VTERVAVYDAFWSTAGGGEKYAAGVADVLSRTRDVTLVAHEAVDTAWLGERLALDLDRVTVEVVDPCEPLERVTAGFDLLVNLSYRSHGRNGARRGLYVVHFPDQPGAGRAAWQRALQDGVGRVLGGRPTVNVEGGFHEPDLIRWQEVRWTNGHGRLSLALPPGRSGTLHLWFGRFVPGGHDREIEVLVDGRAVGGAVLTAPRSKVEVLEPLRIDVPVAGRPGSSIIEVVSDASVADDVLGNGDRRRLGVPLVGATLGRGPLDAIRARASLVAAGPPDTSWLDGYDLVVSNSAFTRRWVDEWWHRPSVVLEPPVGLRAPGPKDQVILSVGRFFAPGRGHAKKQLEMVEAFARMCAGGLTGWELHLVGGCSPEDAGYLDQVRRAARDLPVVLHVDASGAEVDALYRRASLYWHATGLGEDLDADPVRAEHFGITTVEAMSAGAVPVVIAAGGQPEIVTDGVDGVLFRSADELVTASTALIADPGRMAAMAAAAVASSQRFGLERFGERLEAILGRLGEPSA
jgi:glycosyltransferase involved in cell wall biosynthesis